MGSESDNKQIPCPICDGMSHHRPSIEREIAEAMDDNTITTSRQGYLLHLVNDIRSDVNDLDQQLEALDGDG